MSRDKWVWSLGKAGLFGVDNLARACQTGKPVIRCGDLFDVAALRKYGFHSIGTTGATGYWDSAWNTLFYNLTVIIATPNDDDGKLFARMLADQLYGTASEVKVVRWPLNRPVGHTLAGELLQESEKALRTRIRKGEYILLHVASGRISRVMLTLSSRERSMNHVVIRTDRCSMHHVRQWIL